MRPWGTWEGTNKGVVHAKRIARRHYALYRAETHLSRHGAVGVMGFGAMEIVGKYPAHGRASTHNYRTEFEIPEKSDGGRSDWSAKLGICA
jgi:hypothetical protein